jgi:hypothetical protein
LDGSKRSESRSVMRPASGGILGTLTASSFS